MPATNTIEPRFCHDCRYPLTGQSATVCPECGRPFDPRDLRTTSPHPTGDLRRGLAVTARWMSGSVAAIAVVAVAASALGVAPLILWLGGLAIAPWILILLVLVLLPTLPIGQRARTAALLSVAVLVSVVVIGWPFRLSFALHRAAFERRVAAIRTEQVAATRWTPGRTTVGVFRVRTVRSTPEGNVGFQLTGNAGGGTFVVHRAPGSTFTWFNTNWEQDLGNGWWLVEQD